MSPEERLPCLPLNVPPRFLLPGEQGSPHPLGHRGWRKGNGKSERCCKPRLSVDGAVSLRRNMVSVLMQTLVPLRLESRVRETQIMLPSAAPDLSVTPFAWLQPGSSLLLDCALVSLMAGYYFGIELKKLLREMNIFWQSNCKLSF